MPNALMMLGFLLFLPLQRVMAGLAEGLQVLFIPKERGITTVRLDVVTDEL